MSTQKNAKDILKDLKTEKFCFYDNLFRDYSVDLRNEDVYWRQVTGAYYMKREYSVPEHPESILFLIKED